MRSWICAAKRAEVPLLVLRLFIELKDDAQASGPDIAAAVYEQIMKSDNDEYTTSSDRDDLADMIDFRVETTLLPRGAFANYTAQRQAEGADLAHLKPPHVNPSDKVLSLLLAGPEEIKVRARAKTEAEKVTVL